jgi:hypothetical protein
MRLPFLVLASTCFTAVAHADDVAVDVDVDVNVTVTPSSGSTQPPAASEPPGPWLLRGDHWEGEIAIQGAPMGGIDVADLSGGRVGVLAVGARQLGSLRVGLELGVATFWASRDLYTADGWWNGWEDIGGQATRVGASLRYRVVSAVNGAPGLGNMIGNLSFYAEVAAGREHIAFSGGGELDRNDAAFGIGFEFAAGRERFGGMDLGVRVVASQTPTRGIPRCDARCRLDTEDGTADLAVLIHLGALFGG